MTAWRIILICMFFTSATRVEAVGAEIVGSGPLNSGMPVIVVNGPLVLGDGEKFANVASTYPIALVVFSSDGGNLLAGLRIGQYIRLHGFRTLVPDETRCASACAIAWLGGAIRFIQPSARIGFHAAFYVDHGVKTETAAGNALVGAYLSRLGLSDAAILYIEQAHPDEIVWLTKEDAQAVGIDVALLPSFRTKSLSTQNIDTPKPLEKPNVPPHIRPPIDVVAKQFAADYFAHWSENNGDAIRYFTHVYAPKVNFYGQTAPMGVLIDQKRKFAERWPERIYTLRPETLTVHCDIKNSSCLLEGIVNWYCTSTERGARSVGSANFSLTLRISGETVLIESEGGSVISRNTDGP